MSDKSMNQAQIEKLIQMANELEQKELALNKESKHLEQLRASLDERERSLVTGKAEPDPAPRRERDKKQKAPEKNDSIFRERPVAPARQPAWQPAPPPAPPVQAPRPVQPAPAVSRPVPAPAKPKAPASKSSPAAEAVTEINDILKSIFWDYTNSVHQISSQMSTVTAAMMCAAVTCVLENRGFDVKDAFVEEMEKMLQGGGFGAVYPPPSKTGRPATAPAPISAPAPVPVAGPQYLDADDEDEDEDEQFVSAPPAAEPEVSQKTEDGVLRIATAAEFLKLGEYGFRNDDKLTSVEIPEGVVHLPGSFFYGCRNLREVWLPDSLRDIGPYAFYGCEALHTVHLGDNSALREIGEYAFAMCSSLQTFSVPMAVETMGTSVFRFCSSLQKLSFVKNGSLRSIGSHLLQNCTALEKLRLPDNITVIPTSMFYGCSGLKKVVAKGVDTIEDYAFYGNEKLRTIRIHSKRAIAAQAFEGCDPALEIEYLNY